MEKVDININKSGVRFNDSSNEYELYLDISSENCYIEDVKLYNQFDYINPTYSNGISIGPNNNIFSFYAQTEKTDEIEEIKTVRYSFGDNYGNNNVYYPALTNSDLKTLDYDLDLSQDLIIVSVHIEPKAGFDTCSDYRVFAVYNKGILKLEAMAGVREIADTCTIPQRFIDFILRQKAIDLAESNKDVDLLCKYFKMFSNKSNTNIPYTPCGCLKG